MLALHIPICKHRILDKTNFMNDGKDLSKAIGGKARAEALSPEKRSAIAKKGAKARWAKTATLQKPKLLKALYEGPLPIGDVILDVAVLDDTDNTRVINMTSVFKAFGRIPRSNNRLINIPAFIDAQNLQPFIDQELMSLIKPIEYSNGKTVKTGYNALILPAISDVYLRARREGALAPKQIEARLAEKAEILQSSYVAGRGYRTHRRSDGLSA